MIRKLFFLLFLVTLLSNNKTVAQDWLNKLKDPSVNFYEVQKSFNNYYQQKERKLAPKKDKKHTSIEYRKPSEPEEQEGIKAVQQEGTYFAAGFDDKGIAILPSEMNREAESTGVRLGKGEKKGVTKSSTVSVTYSFDPLIRSAEDVVSNLFKETYRAINRW